MLSWTSKVFLLLFACVSKIRPHTKDKKEANIITTLTIKVGKRGTRPVFKNSRKTGINRTIEITPRTWINPAMTFDTNQIDRIDGKSNGNTMITMIDGYKVNVLNEHATMQDILNAYAAAKDSNLTVNIHKEDPSDL